MEKFKKIIRILYLTLLITLAALGIGIAGGIPLSITHKREPEETAIEWVKPDDEESELEQSEIIQEPSNKAYHKKDQSLSS